MAEGGHEQVEVRVADAIAGRRRGPIEVGDGVVSRISGAAIPYAGKHGEIASVHTATWSVTGSGTSNCVGAHVSSVHVSLSAFGSENVRNGCSTAKFSGPRSAFHHASKERFGRLTLATVNSPSRRARTRRRGKLRGLFETTEASRGERLRASSCFPPLAVNAAPPRLNASRARRRSR